MATMKTPGVYIVEKNAFPNSVVEVPTAVPAFIGYTEKALDGTKSLTNKAFRITSLAEYRKCFGGAPTPSFESSEDGTVTVTNKSQPFNLYYHMQLFFANGGGPCYIVSVGGFSDAGIVAKNLTDGIAVLLREQEPTMVVIPEAVSVAGDKERKTADKPSEAAIACYGIQVEALKHCGEKMRNRIAILDIYGGEKYDAKSIGDFREKIGSSFFDFGAVYYPWIKANITLNKELTFLNFDKGKLAKTLKVEADLLPKSADRIIEIDKIATTTQEEAVNTLHKVLLQISPLYGNLLKKGKDMLSVLPPSAAMAGIYTMVDNTRGVWKAPANVSLNSVVSPTIPISFEEQEDLNVPINGKAVNAIRTFIGEGIKVWGARTLDGNSQDWRYINVRRTMIMLEESVKNAARAYVFEPNVASTWINIKSMIENFLNGIWKRGGLAGASPEDAYSVHVGLGETMTSEDILDGILRVTVLVALVRPAEFIEITFQQQMQKS